jgi:malonyl CoA-acyl carrier protein transacylase
MAKEPRMPPLTAQTVVTRRLVITAGGTGPSPAADNDLVAAALRAFGRAPAQLPPRTLVFIATSEPAPGLAPTQGDIPVRTTDSSNRALALAHHELTAKTADFVLIAALGEPTPGAVTVYAVRRAAEAVAEGDSIVGVPEPETEPGAEPVLRPLRHGARATAAVLDRGAERLLLWSGQDERDEQRVRSELRPLIEGLPAEAYLALPTAVPCGHAPGPVRAAVAASTADAPQAVAAAKAATLSRPRPVALLFPGQGSQHAAMAAGLYRREPVFTAAVDAVLDLMGEDGPAIRADWLSRATVRPAIDIDDVRRAQPLLFAVDFALGSMILSWGVRPAALLGHSAGELVAATLAGVVTLPDAVTMVRERVRHAVEIPAGGMLAVAASEERLRPYLLGEVAIAAVNANQQTMLAGPAAQLAFVESRLRADELTVVPVPATSPFHSPAMAPASAAVELAYAAGIRLHEPALPLYSGYTGELLGAEDALSPRFWARQITDTVYFKQALESLLATDDMLLIEAGPRQTLTAFARRHRAVRLGASAAIPLLPARPGPPEADRRSVLNAAARLWTEGHDLDQSALTRLWTWTDEPAPSPALVVS